MFKEVIHRGKIAMILLGFCGALFIIKPGMEDFNKYYFFIFLADFFWALNSTTIKLLGSTERTKAQLFYVLFFSTLFAMPQGLYEWKPIDSALWKYLILLALFYLIHYVAYFKAFKYAEMSLIMPFDYSRVLFTSVLASLVLGERAPDIYTILGYTCIIIGGVYAIKIEGGLKKKSDKLVEIG
jgi:drug/metabolite transporter (DMT)-like permease